MMLVQKLNSLPFFRQVEFRIYIWDLLCQNIKGELQRTMNLWSSVLVV